MFLHGLNLDGSSRPRVDGTVQGSSSSCCSSAAGGRSRRRTVAASSAGERAGVGWRALTLGRRRWRWILGRHAVEAVSPGRSRMCVQKPRLVLLPSHPRRRTVNADVGARYSFRASPTVAHNRSSDAGRLVSACDLGGARARARAQLGRHAPAAPRVSSWVQRLATAACRPPCRMCRTAAAV